jgi:hypothetical protein
MTWTNRPDMTAGSRLLAEDTDAFLDQIDSLTAPGWTSYTPTWNNTSTSPSIGNGSWTGSRYRRPSGMDLVLFEIKLLWGSTTGAGTGSFWSFSFPVTPSATEADWSGIAWLEDTSAGARRFWHAFAFAGAILVCAEAGTLAGTGSPWTWATGDTLRVRGWYEPA